MKEKRRLEKEGGAGGAAESEGGDGDVDSDNSEADDLFGEGETAGMDIS